MSAYFSLLRTRPAYRALWLAQVISLMGDWFNTIALVVIINRYTDSGLAVGGFFVARALPPFLFGPIAGVVADRYNRKTILIVSDLLRAVIVLGLLAVDRPERVWLIYVLSVVQFSVSTFFEPTRAALLPSLIPPEELLTANTLSSSTWSAMLTLGGLIGGIVAALFGTQTALIIDAASFVVSAICVWRVAAPARLTPHSAENGWQNFLAGLAYVRQNPRVGVFTLVKGLGQVSTSDILFALYAKQVFPVGEDGATTLGLMFAAFGAGAVVAPFLANRLGNGTRQWLQEAIIGGYALITLGLIILGVGPTLPIVLVGVVLRGMGGSVNWTYSDVLIQLSVPNEFLGRVFALDLGLFTLAMSVSLWVTGWVVDSLALAPRVLTLWLAAGSVLPCLFWIMVVRALRTSTPA